MKGMGCDEAPIVAILSKRCIKQRVQIADSYKREYGRVRDTTGALTHIRQ